MSVWFLESRKLDGNFEMEGIMEGCSSLRRVERFSFGRLGGRGIGRGVGGRRVVMAMGKYDKYLGKFE